MPAGHPPVGGAAAAPAAPQQNAVTPSPDVPAGTIRVKLVNEKGEPLPNTDVKLGILFQKIAEGEQRSEQHAKTDAGGLASFGGLTQSSDFSYRISARSGPAEYASEPIQLRGGLGVLALLHVYPVTRDLEGANIGARGFVYVETRDDVFQFEVLFRVFNMGTVTWVPDRAEMKLPAGFKAFKAGEAMGDARFEEEAGRGARLAGTFSPGQHNVSFRFQLPRDEHESASFRFGLPPRTAEIRFIAEAAPTMQLDVDGFERPQTDVNQNGQRVLVTRHVAKRGEPALRSFEATLSGIPTAGMGRWIAVLIAAAIAALGGAVYAGKLGTETQQQLRQRDAERAKKVLLDELVALTRARQEQRIGPSTFESARRALVEAMSRIVSAHPEQASKPGKKGKKPTSAGRTRPSGPASTA
ncbi:MAG TPA: hypothetical protein VIW29_10590 [Polyangiaceae bacterium]